MVIVLLVFDSGILRRKRKALGGDGFVVRADGGVDVGRADADDC